MNLVQALNKAESNGFNVRFGEYSNGIEYVELTGHGKRLRCILNSDADEAMAAKSIERMIGNLEKINE